MPSPSDDAYAERVATVLLVDDDPTVRGVVSDYLRAAGHAVIEAGDGITALGMAQG